MVIKFEKLVGSDGGHGNHYTLVREHRIEKAGNHWFRSSNERLSGETAPNLRAELSLMDAWSVIYIGKGTVKVSFHPLFEV